MNMMHYESLTNDKKVNIDMSDVTLQYSSISHVVELNHTRKILILLTSIEFVLSLLIVFVVIYAYVFGYTLGFESYNPIVRFVPFLSCICFLIGLFAADRYHVKGLRLFANLVMLDLILTYLILTIFIVIPICLENYTTNLVPVIIFVISYLIIFCIVSFVPAYTIRVANKLSKLLTDNKCSTMK